MYQMKLQLHCFGNLDCKGYIYIEYKIQSVNGHKCIYTAFYFASESEAPK